MFPQVAATAGYSTHPGIVTIKVISIVIAAAAQVQNSTKNSFITINDISLPPLKLPTCLADPN
jgi:hypothetical protein